MGTKHFYQYVMSASSTATNNASATEFGNTMRAPENNTVIWVGDDGQQAVLTIEGIGVTNKKQTGSATGSSGGYEIWLDKKGYIWP